MGSSRSKRVAVSAALLLSCLGAPAQAQDATSTVVVAPLRADPGDEALARRVTAALERVAGTVPEWRVDGEAGAGITCDPSDAACLAQAAEASGADRLVVGSLARDPSGAIRVSVALHQAGALGAFVDDTVPETEQTDADLEGIAEGLWAAMAGPDFQPEPAVDDAPDEPELPTWDTGFAASVSTESETPVESSSHGRPWNDVRTPVAIGLLSLGGALLLASVYATLRVETLNDDSDFNSFRERVPMGLDVCEELDDGNTWGASFDQATKARAVCDEGQTLSVLGWVFFGAALGSAGAGAALLLIGGDDEAESVSVRPSIGPRTAGLDARLRF